MLLTLKINRLLSDDDVAYEKGVPWSVCDDLTQKAIVKTVLGGDQAVLTVTVSPPSKLRLLPPLPQTERTPVQMTESLCWLTET